MVTALAIGRPRTASYALAAAVICAFLAHEPLLVLLGQRGSRAAREGRSAAIRRLAVFGTLAAGLAAVAIATVPQDRRLALAWPLLLLVPLTAFIAAGREHTIVAESVAAAALASFAYPIGVWSGASSRASLSCAAAFAAVFIAGVVCVHAVIAFTRTPPAASLRAAGAVIAIGAAAAIYGLAAARWLEIITPIAVIPACAADLFLVIRPPSARRLRSVGWTLVATSVVSMLLLLLAFR